MSPTLSCSSCWKPECIRSRMHSQPFFFFPIWLYRTGIIQKILLLMTSNSSPVPCHHDPYPEHPSSGDRPHKSAACRHTQCHYGPFLQNALHPHLQPEESREVRLFWDYMIINVTCTTQIKPLTQSQQGSPVPTLAAMLWKMSLMCGLKNKQTASV